MNLNGDAWAWVVIAVLAGMLLLGVVIEVVRDHVMHKREAARERASLARLQRELRRYE